MGYESFPPRGPKIQCSGGTNYCCIKLAEWNNQNSLERVNFVFAKPLNTEQAVNSKDQQANVWTLTVWSLFKTSMKSNCLGDLFKKLYFPSFIASVILNVVTSSFLIWNLIASMILADLWLGYLVVLIVGNPVGRNAKISVYVLEDFFHFKMPQEMLPFRANIFSVYFLWKQ